MMRSGRLILLGVDGMDFEYTKSILQKLPTLRGIAEDGGFLPFKSVFPPDSIPAWITAYTGKDPSSHGVLESVDYLAKGDDRFKVDCSVFRENTFWDALGRNGIKVAVVNPFMAYPAWEVNGVMISGPVFISGEIQCSAPEFVNDLQIPNSFGGIVDFPTRKNLKEFCDKTFHDTREQINFGLKLLEKNRPDFFFQVFLTMDRLQHFLWRYSDPTDPTYPGKNEYKDMIEKFYILIDQGIGQFLDLLEPHDTLMVISDHGHGMRCTHCFNINEYLRRKGYVKSSAEGKIFSRTLITEKLKNRVLKFMNDHDLEDYISVIAKLVPNAKGLKKGKHITDSSRNIAYASDFTGTNPFGGICVNSALIEDYEKFREKLIDDLKSLEYEGKPVFEWITRREDLYNGEFLEKFPDILFKMGSRFGVNWALHTELFSVKPTHKKISGGHRDLGIISMGGNGGIRLLPDRLKIENLFASILNYYGLQSQPEYSESSFIWREEKRNI